MEKLEKKLHSQKGASMVLSLLFLLFCLTVGAVILTAASTNAGRVRHNREDQKKELAVESAALLLKDDFADLSLVGKYVTTEINGFEVRYELQESGEYLRVETPLTPVVSNVPQMPAALAGTALTAFSQLQQDFTKLLFSQVTVLDTPVAKPDYMRYVLEISPQSGGTGMPVVKAVLRMEMADADRFAITATLCIKEDGSHPMTLRLQSQSSGWQITNASTDTSFTPAPGAGGEGTNVNGTSTVTTRTEYTQSIRWTLPEITKGATT